MHKFRTSGQWLQEALGCEWVNGSTSVGDRMAYFKNFQQGDERVILTQIECVKMGVDLSAADTLVVVEHSFSGDTFIQAMQRTTNLTKSRPSLIVTFATVFDREDNWKSIDLSVYKSVKYKKNFNDKMIETKKAGS